MSQTHYEYLIVGSGAAGATLAKRLSDSGKSVGVLEKGGPGSKLGVFRHAVHYFDANPLTKIPKKSSEGVILWRTFMAGGSTMVSAGNAGRTLETTLQQFGLDLQEEFRMAEETTRAGLMESEHLSRSSLRLLNEADRAGYHFALMPKFVNTEMCTQCGLCTLGCAHDAKWTAFRSLEKAHRSGAEIRYHMDVEQVITRNGEAIGVRGMRPTGPFTLYGEQVILAAGGLGTPVILKNSGIHDAGERLFVDLMQIVYGALDQRTREHEPQMSLVNDEFHDSLGFILSPFVSLHRMVRFIEGGPEAATLPTNKMMGIMVKIKDESEGNVDIHGKVSKPVTAPDREKLDAGIEISKELLIKSGVREETLVVTNPAGAHPGGTAALGEVVDSGFRTRIDNLYVCDGSVLPEAPGKPPIITIMALAERLARDFVSA
jgi:choline dehydrogenase-like flavoprotein